MVSFVEFLHIPMKIAFIIIGIFFIIQIIGELLEFKGKIVPEFVKIRKYFIRKKKEKNETIQTLKEVQELLSKDNTAKRDSWMQWVNSRAEVYDKSIDILRETLTSVTKALTDNTKMTEEMFIQSSRDRIIDFANKVGDEKSMVSREEFNRIFKVYRKYEDFLEERGLTNGEVDIAYRIIEDSYASHMKNHTFLENIRGYDD